MQSKASMANESNIGLVRLASSQKKPKTLQFASSESEYGSEIAKNRQYDVPTIRISSNKSVFPRSRENKL